MIHVDFKDTCTRMG